MTATTTLPLDPTELARVEGMHRGNLYQHLYTVGCILLASDSGVVGLQIDFDEDLELQLKDSIYYIQIKTRAQSIAPSHVSSSIARFDTFRQEHANGIRSGSALYLIISNQPPGHSLEAQSAGAIWQFLWPGGSTPIPNGLPPPWPSVADGLRWCWIRAEALPLRTLSAPTLVWKLAAQIQAVAAGELTFTAGPHRLNDADLKALLEQAAHQLHSFPSVPSPYRDYENTPSLSDVVTMIVGLAGSGKTSWATEVAQHIAVSTVYFDAAIVSTDEFPSALLRELVAQLSRASPIAAEPELAAASSRYEGIRAVDAVLGRRGTTAFVFVDNIHKIDPDAIINVTKFHSGLRWILLSLPHAQIKVLEARLAVTSQQLPPWTLSSIAGELRAHGASASPRDAHDVLELTGGLPMFVRGLALLAIEEYGGQTDVACQAIRDRTITSDLPQETITSITFAGFGTPAQLALALLTDIAASLERKWLVDILRDVAQCEEATAAAALRELVRYGAAQQSQGGEFWAHSSYAGVSIDWGLSHSEQLDRARKRLIDLLRIHEIPFPGRPAYLSTCDFWQRQDSLKDLQSW